MRIRNNIKKHLNNALQQFFWEKFKRDSLKACFFFDKFVIQFLTLLTDAFTRRQNNTYLIVNKHQSVLISPHTLSFHNQSIKTIQQKKIINK